MLRLWLLRAVSVLIGVALPLLLIEAGFNLLPVSNGPWLDTITDEQPTARFIIGQHSTWSMLPSLAHVRHGSTNNAGYLSATDYVPATERKPGSPPVVAVVGDSFVEALMLPLDATFSSKLKKRIANRGDVYSFGISGAPLSQYLVWADHARQLYKPDMLVVSVVSNDFDESLLDYKVETDPGSSRGFHYFVDDGKQLKLKLIENRPSLARRLARSSALICYFVKNAGLSLDASLLARLDWRQLPPTSAATARDMSPRERQLRHLFPPQEFDPLPERSAASRRAIDQFLADLPARAGLSPERIVLTVDALRVSILDPDLTQLTRQSHFGRMRDDVIAKARAANFQVVDLDPPMRALVRETGRAIEFSDDYHWNEDAHSIVADAIASTVPFRKLFNFEKSAQRPHQFTTSGTEIAH